MNSIVLTRAFVVIDALDKTGKAYTSVMTRFSSLASRVAGIGARLSASMIMPTMALKKVMNDYVKFEDQMLSLKAITGSNTKEFNRMCDVARRFGREVTFSVQQVAEAMTEMGRAGFSTKQIEDSFQSVLDFARAAKIELKESADFISATMKTFNAGPAFARQIADSLTAAANASAVTPREIMSAMRMSASIMAQVGMDVKDYLEAIGALGNFGIRGTLAGTVMRRAGTKLASQEKIEEYRRLNVNVLDEKGNMRNLIDILSELRYQLKRRRYTDNQIIAKLSSQHEFGLYGAAGIVALSNSAVVTDKGTRRRFEELQFALENCAGLAAITAAEMDSGVGGAIRFLIASLQELNIVLGKALAPMVRTLAGQIKGWTNTASAWFETNQGIVTSAASAFIGLTALGTAMFVVGTAAMPLASTLGMIGEAFVGLTGILSAKARYFNVVMAEYVKGFVGGLRYSGIAIENSQNLIKAKELIHTPTKSLEIKEEAQTKLDFLARAREASLTDVEKIKTKELADARIKKLSDERTWFARAIQPEAEVLRDSIKKARLGKLTEDEVRLKETQLPTAKQLKPLSDAERLKTLQDVAEQENAIQRASGKLNFHISNLYKIEEGEEAVSQAEPFKPHYILDEKGDERFRKLDSRFNKIIARERQALEELAIKNSRGVLQTSTVEFTDKKSPVGKLYQSLQKKTSAQFMKSPELQPALETIFGANSAVEAERQRAFLSILENEAINTREGKDLFKRVQEQMIARKAQENAYSMAKSLGSTQIGKEVAKAQSKKAEFLQKTREAAEADAFRIAEGFENEKLKWEKVAEDAAKTKTEIAERTSKLEQLEASNKSLSEQIRSANERSVELVQAENERYQKAVDLAKRGHISQEQLVADKENTYKQSQELGKTLAKEQSELQRRNKALSVQIADLKNSAKTKIGNLNPEAKTYNASVTIVKGARDKKVTAAETEIIGNRKRIVELDEAIASRNQQTEELARAYSSAKTAEAERFATVQSELQAEHAERIKAIQQSRDDAIRVKTEQIEANKNEMALIKKQKGTVAAAEKQEQKARELVAKYDRAMDEALSEESIGKTVSKAKTTAFDREIRTLQNQQAATSEKIASYKAMSRGEVAPEATMVRNAKAAIKAEDVYAHPDFKKGITEIATGKVASQESQFIGNVTSEYNKLIDGTSRQLSVLEADIVNAQKANDVRSEKFNKKVEKVFDKETKAAETKAEKSTKFVNKTHGKAQTRVLKEEEAKLIQDWEERQKELKALEPKAQESAWWSKKTAPKGKSISQFEKARRNFARSIEYGSDVMGGNQGRAWKEMSIGIQRGWKGVRESFVLGIKQLFAGIGLNPFIDGLKAFGNIFGGVLQAVGETLKGFWNLVRGLGTGRTGTGVKFFEAAWTAFRNGATGVGNVFFNVLRLIGNGFNMFWGMLRSSWLIAVEVFIRVLYYGNLWKAFLGALVVVIGVVVGVFIGFCEIMNAIIVVGSKVIAKLVNLAAGLFDVIGPIVLFAGATCLGALAVAIKAVLTVTGWLWKALSGLADMFGKLLTSVSSMIGGKGIMKTLEGIANMFTGPLARAFSRIKSIFVDIFSVVPEMLKNGDVEGAMAYTGLKLRELWATLKLCFLEMQENIKHFCDTSLSWIMWAVKWIVGDSSDKAEATKNSKLASEYSGKSSEEKKELTKFGVNNAQDYVKFQQYLESQYKVAKSAGFKGGMDRFLEAVDMDQLAVAMRTGGKVTTKATDDWSADGTSSWEVPSITFQATPIDSKKYQEYLQYLYEQAKANGYGGSFGNFQKGIDQENLNSVMTKGGEFRVGKTKFNAVAMETFQQGSDFANLNPSEEVLAARKEREEIAKQARLVEKQSKEKSAFSKERDVLIGDFVGQYKFKNEQEKDLFEKLVRLIVDKAGIVTEKDFNVLKRRIDESMSRSYGRKPLTEVVTTGAENYGKTMRNPTNKKELYDFLDGVYQKADEAKAEGKVLGFEGDELVAIAEEFYKDMTEEEILDAFMPELASYLAKGGKLQSGLRPGSLKKQVQVNSPISQVDGYSGVVESYVQYDETTQDMILKEVLRQSLEKREQLMQITESGGRLTAAQDAELKRAEQIIYNLYNRLFHINTNEGQAPGELEEARIRASLEKNRVEYENMISGTLEKKAYEMEKQAVEAINADLKELPGFDKKKLLKKPKKPEKVPFVAEEGGFEFSGEVESPVPTEVEASVEVPAEPEYVSTSSLGDVTGTSTSVISTSISAISDMLGNLLRDRRDEVKENGKNWKSLLDHQEKIKKSTNSLVNALSSKGVVIEVTD